MTHDDWMPQVGPRKYFLEPLRPKITSHHRTMDVAGGQEESALVTAATERRGRQCTGPLRVEKNVARETNGRRRGKGNAPVREVQHVEQQAGKRNSSVIGVCARRGLLSILFKKQWMSFLAVGQESETTRIKKRKSLVLSDRDEERQKVDLEGEGGGRGKQREGKRKDWKGVASWKWKEGSSAIHLARQSALTEMVDYPETAC
ncbi:uncharacterized protein An12g08440 [Aspergillus niger]|uniref:Contig An12c0280, genomic contig n=2 Tax=Aspergillus niger TaxID=5061 RepID=A2R0F6_ASPNC|nr:uncharacterized protein An12g08440 [Aspergillus niger]CAK41294.1 unnamed protein product [Aspergillus niger]